MTSELEASAPHLEEETFCIHRRWLSSPTMDFLNNNAKEGKGVLGTIVGGRMKVPFGILCVLLGSLWGCGGGGATPNVSRPTLTSIAISPANPTVAPGATQQFKATATYSDNSTGDLTSSANWSSSNTSNATV